MRRDRVRDGSGAVSSLREISSGGLTATPTTALLGPCKWLPSITYEGNGHTHLVPKAKAGERRPARPRAGKVLASDPTQGWSERWVKAGGDKEGVLSAKPSGFPHRQAGHLCPFGAQLHFCATIWFLVSDPTDTRPTCHVIGIRRVAWSIIISLRRNDTYFTPE
ncbi:hypothetical protein SCLCIDRAFT_647959 [Scleroderma citrinum Foug A]|uniref:Uncharacterized protein n=1 Tax=Scleroderma citrinum Foug A TaxID=1036808 RepID=A0A0C2ZS45_9AGAM|nr:hypothetical protein SCLCIDRAFT_647959 [Scleroderma citrinum Foug A]